MPPRHAYWTIIFGGQPTAFRSAAADDLLPTFKQIQSKHPDAVMMYFARGKLWPSEQAARDALLRHRATRPDRRREAGGARREARGTDWRPGGQHEDPRERFKVPRDVKRRHMAKKFGWRKRKDEDR